MPDITDQIDKRILHELQRDASLSQRELADRVGLSQNACWRRLKALTESGLLQGSVARLDRQLLGLDLVVLVAALLVTLECTAALKRAFAAPVEQS